MVTSHSCMKRPAWLLLAAFCTVLAQVPPVAGPVQIPTAHKICCGAATTDGSQHSGSCPAQPKRECPVCSLGCVNCCLAVLSPADLPQASLSPVARLDHLAEKGLQRANPPQLPPPRGLA